MSRFALQLSSNFSKINQPVDSDWHLLLELTDSLKREDLGHLLAEYLYQNGYENSVLAQSEQERQNFWTLRENISASQRDLGVSIKHDIAMPIIQVADFLENCGSELQLEYPEMRIVVFGHLGDGSLHYNTFLPVKDNRAYEQEGAINQIVYRHILAQNGTIAAEHAIGSLKKHWLAQVRTADEILLMRAIKSQLDPNNLFNADKLLPSV